MTGTNYIRLLNNLDDLELRGIREELPQYLDMISRSEKTVVDALYELSEKEKELRRERAIKACVKTAGFPFIRTVKDFDFQFQPSVDKAIIDDLASLRFIEHSENVLFIGSSGVGKTHLATAIGVEAATNRYSVHFITCQDLVSQLKKAEHENRLERRLKLFSRYRLLIIDEVGYLNYDTEAGNLIFQLVSMRYEKKSTIITTNRNLSKWGEIFGDAVIANAILDRLLHHSHIISIVGPSYRIKDISEQLDD